MKKPLLILITLSVLLCFGLLGVVYQNAEKTQSTTAKPNVIVPVISLPLLSSNDTFDAAKVLGNEILPNKPYLLNVWGSWCIACSREHEMLKKIQKKGIPIIGVNYKDDIEAANNFLMDYGNPFEFVFFDEMGEMTDLLNLKGAPESFMVDGLGIIRQHIVGEITENIWQERIEPCYDALNDELANGVNNENRAKIEQVCQ